MTTTAVNETVRAFTRALTLQQMQHPDVLYRRHVDYDYNGVNLSVKCTSMPSPKSVLEDMDRTFDHFPASGSANELCICGRTAVHRVAEATHQERHSFTSYLCCECFSGLMGAVAESWCTGVLVR